MENIQILLRNLPSVDHLLKSKPIEDLLKKYPRIFVLKAVRITIDDYRSRIVAGTLDSVDSDTIINSIRNTLENIAAFHLRPVINATGVVIHTNLGRAPLPNKVLDNVVRIAEGYSNLEFDLNKGKRGKRYAHLKNLINEITGAEDCLVVNNNAAAVMLCLTALAQGKEVIISRGELVEIGGSFRIPDVMKQSGAIIKEVGTTNKTHFFDYEDAVTENTGLILKVHMSNYRISGFAEEVSVEELLLLGKKYNLPVMYDLGSGCLLDLKALGIHDEPIVQDIVRTGIDVTTFSGDKLLGGPQAGVIVGKSEVIQTIQKHPLTRALRVDKFTLSALEAIFMIYADMEMAKKEIPVLKMLFSSHEALKIRARRLATALKKTGIKAEITMNKDKTKAGGGSLPEIEFATWTVSILPETITVNQLEEKLRKASTPIIGRIQSDRYILDVMTIKTSHINIIVNAVKEILLD